MAVAHLYEVLGVISQPITPAEDMLMKSVDKICDEVQHTASIKLESWASLTAVQVKNHGDMRKNWLKY